MVKVVKHLFAASEISLRLMAWGMLLFSFVFMVWFFLFCPSRISDYKDLLFLTQAETEADVVEHFGSRMVAIYRKGDTLPRQGWKIPHRPISNKMLIYDKPSSLRIYVYIDENGKVEYVFTSHS